MNEKDIANVCQVIANEIRENDTVNITVSSRNGKLYLAITNAPSWIIDAITESGYSVSIKYGACVVTAEED